MFYCDASVLVAVLVTEAHSTDARMWLGNCDPTSLVISGWVVTEVASALAQKQRIGALTHADRTRAQRVWTTAFADRLPQLQPGAQDFERAAVLVDAGKRGLRAGDALHLALAERHNLAMATLDVDLADAATAIGIDVPAIRIGT